MVELRDADRTLRLTLPEPAHVALLRTHLARHGQAILTEAAAATEFGWLGGHVHEIAFPLVTTGNPAPNPLNGPLPVVTNTDGHLPGSPESTWLSAKLFTHPERMDEIIAEHLPSLLATLGAERGIGQDAAEIEPSCWWLRYRSPHEADHLRLRIRTTPDRYATYTSAVGEWAQRMRRARLVGRLVLDTYYPEVGRYGHGAALDAAEEVFAADSHVAAAELRNPLVGVHPTALVVVNMGGIVHGFLGGLAEAMNWLITRSVPAAPVSDRTVADQAIRLALDLCTGRQRSSWPAQLGQAWQARADALAAYRKHLPLDANQDVVLESLLHMHHNRAIGIDPEHERGCRRLARHAALAWRARQPAKTGEPR